MINFHDKYGRHVHENIWDASQDENATLDIWQWMFAIRNRGIKGFHDDNLYGYKTTLNKYLS
jgi:hypothetical protein